LNKWIISSLGETYRIKYKHINSKASLKLMNNGSYVFQVDSLFALLFYIIHQMVATAIRNEKNNIRIRKKILNV
jgi:hypothetical protein